MLYIGPATAAAGLGAILLSALTQSNLLLQVGGVFVAVAILMLVGGFLGYVLKDVPGQRRRSDATHLRAAGTSDAR